MRKKIIESIAEAVDPWEEHRLTKKNIFLPGIIKEALKEIYLWSQRDYLIRYLPVLRELDHFSELNSVLEVGSGPLGLSRYTKRRVVGVDLKTTGPHYQNMLLIGASAGSLPFKDSSFDLVVSLDMLEHIPPEGRADVIRELFRVAKNKIFLGVPTFETAKEFEDRVRRIYERKINGWKGSSQSRQEFIKRNSFLLEHNEFGLPKESEVLSCFNKCVAAGNDKAKIKIIDNESIFVWYYAVLGDMKYNYLRWFMTTVFFILLFPLLARIKFGGCYRKIFIIEKEPVR